MNRNLLLLLPPILLMSLSFLTGSPHSSRLQKRIASLQSDMQGHLPIFLEERSGNILISWDKPDLRQLSHFLVERKGAGSSFIMVGGLNAQASQDRFEFVDLLPVHSNGVMYYRVKICFLDGSFTYSAIKRILHTAKSDFAVTSAGSGVYRFALPSLEAPATLELRSISGALIRQQDLTGREGYVSLAGQPSGTYLLTISTPDNIWKATLRYP